MKKLRNRARVKSHNQQKIEKCYIRVEIKYCNIGNFTKINVINH